MVRQFEHERKTIYEDQVTRLRWEVNGGLFPVLEAGLVDYCKRLVLY